MHSIHRALALLGLVPTLGAAQEVHAAGHSHDKGPALGTIVFPNSGARAAQTPFLRAVALLHSFEYDDAAAAFRAAQKIDPDFALAYYGEALSYSHVLWRYEDLPQSRAAIARLGLTRAERLARARTPLEAAFANAVEDFYQEGSLPIRVNRYARAMRDVAALSRDTLVPEALAFASHALMLQGYLVNGPARDSIFREAIAMAQRVVQANPNHPGGTHYLIHLYDSPGMAREGLAFARAYDKIAPDAEHALHMPSHIYLQLGMWDDVVRSNERAWAASRAGAKTAAGADWHAFAWLHYGYLQQGRVRLASSLVDSAEVLLRDGAGEGYIDASFAITRLQFQQNAEAPSSRRTLTLPPPPAAGMSDRERAFRDQTAYWLTVDAAMRGDSADLARRGAPYLALADSVLAGADVPAARATNALVIRAMEIARRGDEGATNEAWRAAARAEAKLSPFVGPPERVFAGEQWMLSILRHAGQSAGLTPARRASIAEALPALENVLRLCPERSQTLHLLSQVGDLVGPGALRDEMLARLAVNYKQADADRKTLLPPGLR